MKKRLLLILLVCTLSLFGCAADKQDNISGERGEAATVMFVYVNSNKLEVELEDNSSVTALLQILKNGDIVYTAQDYGNFEKVGDIGYALPRNDGHITAEPGDVILYQGSSICLYYGVNAWNFTRLGKINGYAPQELRALLGAGQGAISVTLSLN